MDGVFTSLNRAQQLLDLVDDEWLADQLSDDGNWRYFERKFALTVCAPGVTSADIEVPPEHDLVAEEDEALAEQEAKAKAEEDKWTELALAQFLESKPL